MEADVTAKVEGQSEKLVDERLLASSTEERDHKSRDLSSFRKRERMRKQNFPSRLQKENSPVGPD